MCEEEERNAAAWGFEQTWKIEQRNKWKHKGENREQAGFKVRFHLSWVSTTFPRIDNPSCRLLAKRLKGGSAWTAIGFIINTEALPFFIYLTQFQFGRWYLSIYVDTGSLPSWRFIDLLAGYEMKEVYFGLSVLPSIAFFLIKENTFPLTDSWCVAYVHLFWV